MSQNPVLKFKLAANPAPFIQKACSDAAHIADSSSKYTCTEEKGVLVFKNATFAIVHTTPVTAPGYSIYYATHETRAMIKKAKATFLMSAMPSSSACGIECSEDKAPPAALADYVELSAAVKTGKLAKGEGSCHGEAVGEGSEWEIFELDEGLSDDEWEDIGECGALA
ncbi:hypothetical protein B0A50_04459 [Salinomyces thailandicus]|uniref:Uncharacterized protein n=1 Tax=Salinomyces thailandicus TaxID=706561 RepID=A0A4U0TYV8_9PEZI|nr:hypothetical protein B0A50_04459 [Salinomyces thailandica]